MKHIISKVLFLFFVITILAPVNIYSQNKNPEGSWIGALRASGLSLRIVFHINKTENGNYKATMDSPDQGVKDIPVGKITLYGDSIKMEMPQLRGEYRGRFDDEGTSIEGKWTQAGQTFPLNIELTNQPVVINRPQEPKEPYPYNSEDITFENKTAGNTLAGTFTYPKSGDSFPTVILITGSGAQNRNEELLGHKPFLVLSDYLTRQGIAVLRFDDRGVGKSTGDFKSATSEDFATDVMAGIEFLKTRKEVNKKEIGLIGHSEGGLIAPMVAVESPDVAFIVLMAGPGLPGDQILLEQSALIKKANGDSDDKIKKISEFNENIYNIIKTVKDSTQAHKQIAELMEKTFDTLTDEEQKEIGGKENLLKGIPQLLSPWFRYFINYDPRPTLEKVKCPVLAINGEKDLQVPPKADLAAISEALTKGGNNNFKTVELKGLNHLFQTATTGSPSEYNQIEETISPTALKTMGDWILEITK